MPYQPLLPLLLLPPHYPPHPRPAIQTPAGEVWPCLQVAPGSNLTLAGLAVSSQAPAASPLPSLAYPPLSLAWEDADGTKLPLDVFGTLLPDFLSFTAASAGDGSLAVLTLMDVAVEYWTCPPAWVTLAKLLSQPSGVRPACARPRLAACSAPLVALGTLLPMSCPACPLCMGRLPPASTLACTVAARWPAAAAA